MVRSTKASPGSTRIRLIVFEAETEGTDLSEMIAAVQSALKPRSPASETRLVHIDRKIPTAAEHLEDEPGFEPDTSTVVVPIRKIGSTSSRRLSSPTVVDVDWKSAKIDITDFIKLHEFSNVTEKYLGVLSWYVEALDRSSINVNEVYTCFRKIGWATSSRDFSQPLRDLKVQQLITGSAKSGFSINHLGLDRVSKLKI